MNDTMDRVQDHYDESLQFFHKDNIVGIFLQGSQNYGLDTEFSDVDTKLVVTPSFKEISLAKPPMSTTHIRYNEEHIEFKDIRLILQTFRKQSFTFLEILFTPYKIVNPLYQEQWNKLEQEREAIARYAPYQAVKTMKNIAIEKYRAIEHKHPNKVGILAKYGYGPKQLHHLLRVREFINKYTAGENYEDCLRPHDPEYLKSVKLGLYNLAEAREVANAAIADVITTAENFCDKVDRTINLEIEELLYDVQYQIMKISIQEELK